MSDSPVIYHLRPRAPGSRILEVACKLRDPDPEGQVVSLPAWIPGSYLIRDFARHVVSLEASCDGDPVPLRKLDKASWRAAPVEGELLLRAEIYASDLSVRGAHLDPTGVFFNGSSVFLRVHGREDDRHLVHLSPGEDAATAAWQVATTMPRLTGAAWEFGAFEAGCYAELIDHPVLMGVLTVAEFDAAGVPHALVLAGRHEADLPRLQADLSRLCAWQIGFFGEPAPMDRYLFLVRLTGDAAGGLEHRASSALVCHRSHLPRRGQVGMSRDYRGFLGLASHEYFHAWNVKRICAAELIDGSLDREAYTRQLWIFEGITSYYDDLALLRSGLVSAETYLELLGRTLTAVYRSGGRRRQTLEEASFDAWIKFYRPDENTPNSQVSYYAKGAMVALALDLEVRLRSSGRVSLDDIMRVLWDSHGRRGQPLQEGAFEELAAEVSGLDLSEFFRTSLRSTVDPPVGILLAQFGVRLQLRCAEGAGDAGGTPGQRAGRPRPWLGLRTRALNGRCRVSHVIDGGPAQAAGLLADDELVALNGLRLDADGFDSAIDSLATGQPVVLHVFRRDELLQITLQVVDAPKDSCYLAFDADAGEAALMRRQAWLGNPPG
ncbi:MAG: PDZ domain-containing protein [Gammaproteobacteria bacterium]|nr:PDZ domain-containing protein [Gammaproteobacteria bacterium]